MPIFCLVRISAKGAVSHASGLEHLNEVHIFSMKQVVFRKERVRAYCNENWSLEKRCMSCSAGICISFLLDELTHFHSLPSYSKRLYAVGSERQKNKIPGRTWPVFSGQFGYIHLIQNTEKLKTPLDKEDCYHRLILTCAYGSEQEKMSCRSDVAYDWFRYVHLVQYSEKRDTVTDLAACVNQVTQICAHGSERLKNEIP